MHLKVFHNGVVHKFPPRLRTGGKREDEATTCHRCLVCRSIARCHILGTEEDRTMRVAIGETTESVLTSRR